MYDLAAIETINFEQLATATDRLLLHRGQVPKFRPGTDAGAGASRRPPPAVHDEDAAERTVYVRPGNRRGGFDGTTILVSGLVTGIFSTFAAIALAS